MPYTGDIDNKVLQIVAFVKGVDPESIRADATFDELGIDSLDRINILFEAEGEFNIDIPDEQARSINSIDAMIAHLTDYLRPEKSRRI